MHDLKKLQEIDPLKRMAEKQSKQEEFSLMAPPDAYAPPNIESVPYEKMPSLIQKLMDEHQSVQEQMDAFEKVLIQLQQNGLTPDKEIDTTLREFFTFIDETILRHQLIEEKLLFPLLQKKLLEQGEHGAGQSPQTAIDVMEADHIKIMQLAAVTFNLLALSARLSHLASRAMVLDAAIEQGKQIVEIMRLHIFREDNVVFSLAEKYLSDEEFKELEKQLPRFEHY